ncbi:MAG: PAS domain S-box protein [Ignavibacteriaceae bacterium]
MIKDGGKSLSGKQFRILIIDDKNETSLAEQEILKVLKHPVFSYIYTEKECLKKLKDFKPDVIISEVTLPEITTNILLQEILAKTDVPLILFTSACNEAGTTELLNAGAWDFVSKEFPARLSHSVIHALEQKKLKVDLSFAEKDLIEYEKHTNRYRHWESNVSAIVYSFVMQSDETYHFTYLSSACEKLLGYKPEDIVKDPSLIPLLMHPEDFPKMEEAIKQSALTLSQFNHEARIILNKETRWFSFMSDPELQENGDILWSGIIMDITEKKRIEEALVVEHNLMHILMDNSPDTIYFKDSESRFIKVNKGYLTKYGINSEKDILGKTDFDLFNQEHAGDARNDEIKIMLSGEPLTDKIEKEIWGNDKIAWVSSTKTPLRDSDGTIIGTFGVSRDITERRKAEDALAAERNLMRTLMDAIPDHIYVKDTDGNYLLNNKAHLDFLGRSTQEEVIGKSIFDFLSKDLAEPFHTEDKKVAATGESLENLEIKIALPGRENRWFISTKVPLFSTEGNITGVVGISHDITSIKEIQEKLITSEERLRYLVSSTSAILFRLGISNGNPAPVWIGDNVKPLLGYTPEEVTTPGWWEKELHPDDVGYVNSIFPTLFKENKLDFEFRFRHKEGHYIWLHTELALVHDADGNPLEIFGSWVDITERMMAQEALLTSEAQLSYSLKIARLAHWEYDVYSNQLILNDQFYSIFRTNAEKEGGYIMSIEYYAERFIAADDANVISNALQIAISAGDTNYSEQLEYRIKYADGESGYMSVRFFVSMDSNGKTNRTFGIIQDITERKVAENALRISEGQLSNALKIANLAYWECDTITGIFTFNDQFYSLYRTTAEKEGGYIMSAQNYAERFVYPDDREVVGKEIQKSIETDDPNFSSYVEHRVVYADGQTGYVAVRFYIIKDKTGKTIGTYGANQDISQQRKAEEALRASEYFLKKSQSVAHVGSYKFSLQTGNWESSETLDDIFGIDEKYPRNIDGQNKLLHPAYRDKLNLLIIDVLRKKRSRFETEYKIIRPNDGQVRWVLSKADVELDREGKPVSIISAIQDITERVLHEQEKLELEKQLLQRNEDLEKMVSDLKKMQGSLVQSEKMASLGQLSAGIAHEINNPLSYVSSNVNRLKEYFADTIVLLKKWEKIKDVSTGCADAEKILMEIEKYSEEIDIKFILEDFERMMISIHEGTQRIKKIVEGMRGFAHITDKSFSEANITRAIDDTLTIVWNEIKYKATIEKDYADLPPVVCNIGEIKQVLVNLLVNAAHAIDGNGVIKISTGSDSDNVFIKVQDSGSGISTDKIKRIFDPFFTTKPVGEGTGLGLWISSTIIEKHNGTLTVESEPGTGSTFTIQLPVKQQYEHE